MQSICSEQQQNEQEKLKEINCLVKELKNSGKNQISCRTSWLQIGKHANFLLQFLSKQKIVDRTVFYQTLASLDSLLSIYKIKLFVQLKFRKSFYRNIQKEFQLLCLQYNFIRQQKEQRQAQFQLYSILFLLVMLIYFSGKGQSSQFRNIPLQIINKSFINSLISLQININQKNQRIIGLILAYLIKNINLRIYGEKILKFILLHFDKISMPRTVYHFVYCLRQIHMKRQIDIKIVTKWKLVDKLWNFWLNTFQSRESIYLVDYINVIFKKYPNISNHVHFGMILGKISQFNKINQFFIIHQALILQILTKFIPKMNSQIRQKIMSRAFQSCKDYDFSLRYIASFINYEQYDYLMGHIFQFVQKFRYICHYKELKNVIFGLEIIIHLLDRCVKNNSWGILLELRVNLKPTLNELKQFHICRKSIIQIEQYFSKLISIQYQTLS